MQPWAAKPPAPHEQMPITKITDGFTVEDMGSSHYTRKVPAIYSTDKDDRLMWSLIMQYATEGNTNNEPNGHFYLDAKKMEKVAREVV